MTCGIRPRPHVRGGLLVEATRKKSILHVQRPEIAEALGFAESQSRFWVATGNNNLP